MSTSTPLPTKDQCFALTDEQCRKIQEYRDPDGIRPYRTWELEYQPELIRLYMSMLSFPHIEQAMRPRLDWSYKTYANRFRDWRFPVDRGEREQVVADAYALVFGLSPLTITPFRSSLPIVPQSSLPNRRSVDLFSPTTQSHERMKTQSDDQISLLTIESRASTNSSASVYSRNAESFDSRKHHSRWDDNASISSAGSMYTQVKVVRPESHTLTSPVHDNKSGIWNGALRVIPCLENHSHLKWNDSFEPCAVCGFSQWHALMAHAPTISIDQFVYAMRCIKNVKKTDLAWNHPSHFLMSSAAGIEYFERLFDLFQIDGCFDQNIFGQNPLHVLKPQGFGEQIFVFLEFIKSKIVPSGLPFTQRDIFCHTPLYNLFQIPHERSFYLRILKIFPYPEHQLRCYDTSGRTITEAMRVASLKVLERSTADYAKIQAGITEARQFLFESEGTTSTDLYSFHDIARGARGTSYFGFYQCRICEGINAHSNSYLDQMKCACTHGRDRGAADASGMTPVHALLATRRCNDDSEQTGETPSQIAELFRELLPSGDPLFREVLHILDPKGNSLVYNIAVRGLYEVLEHVLQLEESWRRPLMVNTYGRAQDGTRCHVLKAIADGIQLEEIISIWVKGDVNHTDKLERLRRVRDILTAEGAQLNSSDIVKESLQHLNLHDRPSTSEARTAIVPDSSAQRQYNSQPTSLATGGDSDKNRTALQIFPISESIDSDLITSWHESALPTVRRMLCTKDDSSISIGLLRQGVSLEDSQPVLRIQTSKPRSIQEQAEITQAVSDLLLPVAAPRIIFKTGTVKRTATRSDLDRVPCTARNTYFSRRPPMGVSIGVGTSIQDTATLGGYIYIDGVPHILTVYHLFVDEENDIVYETGTLITQPSMQEVKEFGQLWNTVRLTGELFHLECIEAAFARLRSCIPAFSFGSLAQSSGFRNRRSRDKSSNVEMDWAVCKVDINRMGSNTTPCESHWCRETSLVIPGGEVFSVGRTSGKQYGVINGTTMSLSLLNDSTLPNGDEKYRHSEEWTVIRPEVMAEENWITSGIGSSGDSGAWILDAGTDHVVGQLWGRDFEGDCEFNGQIITYFTPILDIFDDIRERTGASDVSISGTQGCKQIDAHQDPSLIHNTPLRFPPPRNLTTCRICDDIVSKNDGNTGIPALGSEIAQLLVAMQHSCSRPETQPVLCVTK